MYVYVTVVVDERAEAAECLPYSTAASIGIANSSTNNSSSPSAECASRVQEGGHIHTGARLEPNKPAMAYGQHTLRHRIYRA